MTDKPKKKIWSRRDFLMQSGGGMAGLALASLMNDDKEVQGSETQLGINVHK